MVDKFDLVLCKKHGHLFELFFKYSLEPISTIIEFLASEEQLEFDKRTMVACSQDEMYSFTTFIKERDFYKFEYQESDKDILFFIGYLTQYIGYLEECPISTLFSKEDILWLWSNYDTMHTQDINYVWSCIKEMREEESI